MEYMYCSVVYDLLEHTLYILMKDSETIQLPYQVAIASIYERSSDNGSLTFGITCLNPLCAIAKEA
jgi:hypothetical protein